MAALTTPLVLISVHAGSGTIVRPLAAQRGASHNSLLGTPYIQKSSQAHFAEDNALIHLDLGYTSAALFAGALAAFSVPSFPSPPLLHTTADVIAVPGKIRVLS